MNRREKRKDSKKKRVQTVMRRDALFLKAEGGRWWGFNQERKILNIDR